MAQTVQDSQIPTISEFLARKRQEPPLGINGLSRRECRRLIAELGPADWHRAPTDVLAFVSLLVNRGLAREAFDVLLRVDAPNELEVQQVRASAMARTGAIASSTALLQSLLEAGHTDVETLGLLGSNEKAFARHAGDATAEETHWRRAREYYAMAFDRFGEYWPGINAAAVTLRLGDPFEARKLAAQVERVCQAYLDRGERGDYWLDATLAESYLIRGQLDAARQAYSRAITSHRADISSIGTTYRQARQILADLHLDPTSFDHIFRMPQVVVFSGHRSDAKDRAAPRLPRRNLKKVAAGLKAYLAGREGVLGYASAADGGDILFLEALLEVGGELHIVLPMEVAEFRKFSVRRRQDKWRKRFDRIIEQADSLTVTGEGIDPSNDAHFEYCNMVTLGLARIKARELATDVSALTVWDGEPGLPGGTGHCLGLWQRQGLDVTVLDPRTGQEVEPGAARGPEYEGAVKSMVFADIVGYSSLDERGIAAYYSVVLPQIAMLTEKLGMREVMRDSWGDAFYFVFEATTQAARFALSLQRLFRDLKLPGSSGSESLKVRIGVHAGPLASYYDPIRDRMNYTGRHTSKAARTEPIADENQIIATQQFAALLTNDAPGAFELAYAGELSLAKGYGTERMFVLTSLPG